MSDVEGFYKGSSIGSEFRFFTIPNDQNWTISFDILSAFAQIKEQNYTRVVNEFFINKLEDETQNFTNFYYLNLNQTASLTYDKLDVSPYFNTSYLVPWPKLYINGSNWTVSDYSVSDQNVTWSDSCGVKEQTFSNQ